MPLFISVDNDHIAPIFYGSACYTLMIQVAGRQQKSLWALLLLSCAFMASSMREKFAPTGPAGAMYQMNNTSSFGSSTAMGVVRAKIR